jgi:predicted nucleotidyltransferase
MTDPRTTVSRLTSQMKRALGVELKSVILFGSVPRGEAIPGVSDLNLLVLVDSLAPTRLAKLATVLQDWVRNGNTPPHIHTLEEWRGMGDSFAIEIADMLDSREVLWGADLVTPDRITRGDLRIHAEREIRQTILHLRLRLLLAANFPDEVGNLLLSGLPSFAAYMRAALRLGGQEAPLDTGIAIERAAVMIGADPGAMLQCWQARRTLRRLLLAVTDPLVERYTEFTKTLLHFLDSQPASTDADPSVGGRAAHVPASH